MRRWRAMSSRNTGTGTGDGRTARPTPRSPATHRLGTSASMSAPRSRSGTRRKLGTTAPTRRSRPASASRSSTAVERGVRAWLKAREVVVTIEVAKEHLDAHARRLPPDALAYVFGPPLTGPLPRRPETSVARSRFVLTHAARRLTRKIGEFRPYRVQSAALTIEKRVSAETLHRFGSTSDRATHHSLFTER